MVPPNWPASLEFTVLCLLFGRHPFAVPSVLYIDAARLGCVSVEKFASALRYVLILFYSLSLLVALGIGEHETGDVHLLCLCTLYMA